MGKYLQTTSDIDSIKSSFWYFHDNFIQSGIGFENGNKIILVLIFFSLLLQSSKIMQDDKENIPALKQEKEKQTWFS